MLLPGFGELRIFIVENYHNFLPLSYIEFFTVTPTCRGSYTVFGLVVKRSVTSLRLAVMRSVASLRLAVLFIQDQKTSDRRTIGFLSIIFDFP